MVDEFVGRGGVAIRLLTDQDFVHDQAQAVNVSTGRNAFAFDLLRRDIGGRADQRPFLGNTAHAQVFGNAKVSQVSILVFFQENVVGFDVPMDHTFAMGNAHSGGDLVEQ